MSQPSPLAALQHRALALRAAGDVAGACRLLADAIDPLRASFGEDHPEVLGTAHLLARLHREADDPAAARRVLEEALAAGERRWHPADPLMLAFSFDLASVAEELGNRHEARRHYSRVAEAGPAVLGADHPAVQAARHYLGGAGAGTTPPLPPIPPPPRYPTTPQVPPAFPRQPPPPPLPVSAPPRQPPPPPPRIPAPSRSPESAAPATTRHGSEPPHPATVPGVPPAPPVAAPPAAATKPPSGTDAPPQQPVSPWAPQAAPPAPRIPAPPRPGPGGQGGPVPQPPPAPARGWDEPTIQVRQIDPLLREEAARQEAIRAATGPGGDSSPAPAIGAGPSVGAPPGGGPVSGAPASAPPARDTPVDGRPVSGTPASGSPASGSPFSSAPVSASPVSGTPVSGSPVPPWGMTAPPWSGVSPPQSPAEPVGAEPTARDDAEPTAPIGAEPTAPGWVGHPPAESTDQPGPRGQGHGAAQPDVPVPPPAPDRRPAARPHQPPWPGQGAVEPGPVGHGHVPVDHGPVEHGPVAQGWDGQSGQGGPAWPERGGGEADDGYPSPREAWQTTYPQEEQAGRGRLMVVVAVVVALVVLVVMVGVAVLVLGRDGAPPPTQATPPSVAAGPTVDGPPPGDLKLRDDSSTITLTWTDPSAGAVPFMVAGGRAGQKLGVMATVDPGQTSYTVNGLNARVDYCFTVLAVYSTDAFATSGQVCTQRERTATPR
ncbi:tetratricopeptide repeat protein [Micromonospora haikouensis]|uniref:fibronectin type III domain-containing protein n=1 Tax=Micromonospora haikouensis TaxID=686309 RepID=UPI00368C3A00